MSATKRSTVVGVFADRRQAQQAVAELKRAGFREDQIGVVSHGHDDATSAAGAEKTTGSHVAEGAVTGVAAGAGVGALWALGIMAGFLPAIGPVVAGGIFASILASAAGGAAIAGIAGALIGLGIPEHEAAYYEGEVKAGRTLVTVKAENRYDEADAILRRFGAYDHANRQSAPASMTAASSGARAASSHAGGSQTVQVHEERLHANKQSVNTGEVRVRKEVVTEEQTITVPTTREEVVIERRPASGHASSSDIRAGEEIRIPVKEEKVNVSKEAVVTEEVSVGKRQVTENQQVGGTVRKEKVRVEETGDVDVKNRQK